MKGYVAHKGKRWYAVVYEGLDPVTGRERRRWHPAGVERADAERLAARLAEDLEGRNDEVRALTFGAYLTTRWLPGKRIVLADSTYASYRRNVELHVLPTVGRYRCDTSAPSTSRPSTTISSVLARAARPCRRRPSMRSTS